VLGQGLGQWQAAASCGGASVLQKRAASSHAENTNTFLREVSSMWLSCCVAVWCCLVARAPVWIQVSMKPAQHDQPGTANMITCADACKLSQREHVFLSVLLFPFTKAYVSLCLWAAMGHLGRYVLGLIPHCVHCNAVGARLSFVCLKQFIQTSRKFAAAISPLRSAVLCCSAMCICCVANPDTLLLECLPY
jgi:hypothetical protein